MTIKEKIIQYKAKIYKVIRSVLLVGFLSFIIYFCMVNNNLIKFKIPLSDYSIYMPLFLVIFIAPIILKIIRFLLSILIK